MLRICETECESIGREKGSLIERTESYQECMKSVTIEIRVGEKGGGGGGVGMKQAKTLRF